MAKPVSKPIKASPKAQSRFPWLLLVLVVGTVYLFWIYPFQRGSQPVEVQFEAANAK